MASHSNALINNYLPIHGTRVIVADDHPVVVQGIKDILGENHSFCVVATFNDGRALLQSPILASADVLFAWFAETSIPRKSQTNCVFQLLLFKHIVVTS